MRSLHFHSRQRQGTRKDGPVGFERQLVMDNVVAAYEAAAWTIPDDFMTCAHYERSLLKLDWTSSPGYPYLMRNPTNGDLFGVVNGVPDQAKKMHVWDIIQQRLKDRDCDPIRLFIKPEPHKLKKLENGKYRLISSVSVIDQLIDHMLFDMMNDKLCEEWPFVPSKIGWSQALGGWRSMPYGKGWLALDRSAWDWTVQIWLIEMALEVRMRLCRNLTEEWKELATWRYKMLFLHPEFITSGGTVLKQVNPGVMKSGCLNTISDNSIMQSIVHERVCMELGIDPGILLSMGDDTLQEEPENLKGYLDLMSQFCNIKDPVKEVEFAGMRFYGRRVEPMYKGKHAFVLLHVDPEILPQLANSYALLYHRSIYRNTIEDLFLEMGQEIVSRVQRDAIYDGL